jgi:uncharacterized membrane protein YccC
MGQVGEVPLRGLWAVLTAVIVTQASVGASIRASLEYVLGTLTGALYASLVSLLIPHSTPLTMGVVLLVSIAPLAYAAARSALFRVAPFTAAIVLLLAGEFGQGAVAAALTRVLEVALGGTVAVLASLLIFPTHAYRRARQSAVIALERLSQVLPVLLAGLSRKLTPADVQRSQDGLGAAVASFNADIAEARHEQALSFAPKPSAGPLSRTLLRLRHDLVIIGRAAANPFPDVLQRRLTPLAATVGSSVTDYLIASAHALSTGQPPPSLEQANTAMDAYESEVSAIHNEGVTWTLSTNEVEQLFALGFAFDQLRRNLSDLERCVRDWMVS